MWFRVCSCCLISEHVVRVLYAYLILMSILMRLRKRRAFMKLADKQRTFQLFSRVVHN
jgi:hypothetical protein